MPFIIVADSGYEKQENNIPATGSKGKYSFTGFVSDAFTKGISADFSNIKIDSSACISGKKITGKSKFAAAEMGAKPSKNKLPVPDYNWLAERLMGFAVVSFVSDNCFEQLKNKLGISIKCGEILLIHRKQEIKRLDYNEKNMNSLMKKLSDETRLLLKRSYFTFGDVLFYSDARLEELSEKRSESLSQEEELKIFKQENIELKESNNALIQRNTDLQLSIEDNRTIKKKLKNSEDRIDGLNILVEELQNKCKEYDDYMENMVKVLEYYKNRSIIAASFPTEKDKVCEWARANFSETIIISPRAEKSFRKYDGALETAAVCDGICYLDAYVRNKRKEITNDELKIYAETYNWEVMGCGSETLRACRDDYTVSIDGTQYLLDMHIKHGVNSKALIRIYFHWDEKQCKLIIGYMPDHLPTASKTT